MLPTSKTTGAIVGYPKLDKPYDILQVFENMHQGKVNGYICQGFNPLASAPCKVKVAGALSKLKFMVVIDPLATEFFEFWQNHGEYNDVDPTKIQTEVFRLPSTCFAEEDGSLVNSGRWLQWHWKAADPPGDAEERPSDHGGHLSQNSRNVPKGRWSLFRSDPQPHPGGIVNRTTLRLRNWPGNFLVWL